MTTNPDVALKVAEKAKTFFLENPIDKLDLMIHNIGGEKHYEDLSPLRDFLSEVNAELNP